MKENNESKVKQYTQTTTSPAFFKSVAESSPESRRQPSQAIESPSPTYLIKNKCDTPVWKETEPIKIEQSPKQSSSEAKGLFTS